MVGEPPEKLGKYEIIEELGRGGFAVVYKALDTTLDRIVALKILKRHFLDEPGFVDRFKREAQAAASLHHLHIVTIYEVDEAEGNLYIAMRFLDGSPLSETIEEKGPVPLPKVVEIGLQIASALDYIHSLGLIHRDVKSGNIIVEKDGQATLTDFGLVKAADGTRYTTLGEIMGTPEFMSPEQVEGPEVDFRSDLYSFGVVLYQACTGQVPFKGETPSATHYLHVHKAPRPPSELNLHISPEVEQVLLKALAKDKEERYRSAAELVDAFGEAISPAEAPQIGLERPEEPPEEIPEKPPIVEKEEPTERPAVEEREPPRVGLIQVPAFLVRLKDNVSKVGAVRRANALLAKPKTWLPAGTTFHGLWNRFSDLALKAIDGLLLAWITYTILDSLPYFEIQWVRLSPTLVLALSLASPILGAVAAFFAVILPIAHSSIILGVLATLAFFGGLPLLLGCVGAENRLEKVALIISAPLLIGAGFGALVPLVAGTAFRRIGAVVSIFALLVTVLVGSLLGLARVGPYVATGSVPPRPVYPTKHPPDNVTDLDWLSEDYPGRDRDNEAAMNEIADRWTQVLTGSPLTLAQLAIWGAAAFVVGTAAERKTLLALLLGLGGGMLIMMIGYLWFIPWYLLIAPQTVSRGLLLKDAVLSAVVVLAVVVYPRHYLLVEE